MRTNARVPRPFRLGSFLMLVAAFVAPSTAVPADPAGPAQDVASSQASRRVAADARTGADELRAALEGGKLSEGLAALLDQHSGPTLERRAADHTRDMAGLAAVPAGIRPAVADLRGAVGAGLDLLGPLDPADVLQAADAISVAARDTVRSTVIEPGQDQHALIPPLGEVSGTVSTFHPTEAELPAAVERAARLGPAAASLIARALDRALPALTASASTRGASGTRAAGCDLVDQTPLLCVGSEANNRYTDDVALLLDLGGDDTYEMSAGGAPFLGPEGAAAVPISVNVDLAGNDRYVSGALIDLPGWYGGGAFGGIGAAMPGGVGIAVDLKGDDVYTSMRPGPAGNDDLGPRDHGLPWSLIAQGAAAAGVGILVDDGGNGTTGDRYMISAPSSTDDQGLIVGQGGAGILGTGLLVDRGDGPADRYVLDGGLLGKEDVSAAVSRTVVGQGAANGGVGALYDEGAGDLAVTANARWVPEDDKGIEYFAGSPAWISYAPTFSVWAQGHSHGGGAFLLGGDGDTSYAIDVESEGIAMLLVFGQGTGLAGPGVLDDPGGDDSYRARAVREHVQQIVVGDGTSACPNPADCRAMAVVDHILAGAPFLLTQGGAWSGTGVLRDRGNGDDAYQAESGVGLSVTLLDELSNPTGPPMLGLSSSNHQPQLVAQGAGDLGMGVLVDEGGSDTYDARYLKETDGSATSRHAAGEPEVTAVNYYRIRVGAQGAATVSGSEGALFDLGGSGDRFTASGLLRARTLPNPDGAIDFSSFWPSFQGGGNQSTGLGTFEALGEDPVIVSSPSQPVCSASDGLRGFGQWAECWTDTVNRPADPEHSSVDTYGRAIGSAPGAVGRSPSLTITPDTASAVEGGTGRRLDVGVVLRDPAGEPIPGAVVHVDLHYGLCVMNSCAAVPQDNAAGVEGQWLSAFTADGVTDEDGVARVRLPLDLTDQTPPDWRWRVFATYDGGPGLHARHAAKPLEIG